MAIRGKTGPRANDADIEEPVALLTPSDAMTPRKNGKKKRTAAAAAAGAEGAASGEAAATAMRPVQGRHETIEDTAMRPVQGRHETIEDTAMMPEQGRHQTVAEFLRCLLYTSPSPRDS